MPWNQEEGMLALPPPNAGVGLAWVGLQQQPEQAWPAGIVNTLTAAAADAAAAASIGRSSTSSSWLSRKPSFKASKAVSKLRAVSVTTMAAAAAVTNRSPSHHHRVGSAKSANSAKATLISRKNSETSLKFENLKNPSRMKHSASSHEVSSPCSSIASQDMSLPALESEADCGNVVFDMTLTSKDSLSEENTSSRYENDSILSFDDSSSLQPICEGDVASSDPEAVSPIQDQVTSSNVVQDSPDSLSTFDESKIAFADESEWAKQALKMRRDKGRIDSTSTNEVTVINTILNKNLTVTDEGNAIRRRIELQSDESPKDNLEIMKIMRNAPDLSSRFSFSNEILVAIFFSYYSRGKIYLSNQWRQSFFTLSQSFQA